MIVLDADVLLIDWRYTGDPRSVVNRQALQRLGQDGHDLAVTAQVMLEIVGVLSYQTSAADVPLIPDRMKQRYGVIVLPDPAVVPEYAGCTVAEIVSQMTVQMALGDAVMAVQLAKFAPPGTTLLTWNSKHFRGKVAVPVLTPEEWLLQQTPQTGPTP